MFGKVNRSKLPFMFIDVNNFWCEMFIFINANYLVGNIMFKVPFNDIL